MTESTQQLRKEKSNQSKAAFSSIGNKLKYDIICGTGQHRMYTAALAEIIMLNKYGNQPDYFWRQQRYYEEYVRLIKIAGRIAKQIGKEKFAYFLYKNPDFKFEDDVGLVIHKLKTDKIKFQEFTMEELIKVYKNKFRPPKIEINQTKTVREPKKNLTVRDFLGDI